MTGGKIRPSGGGPLAKRGAKSSFGNRTGGEPLIGITPHSWSICRGQTRRYRTWNADHPADRGRDPVLTIRRAGTPADLACPPHQPFVTAAFLA
jgi:hypothetical protein